MGNRGAVNPVWRSEYGIGSMKKLRFGLLLLLLILLGGAGAYFVYQHGDSLFRRKIQEASKEQQEKVAEPTFDVVRVERTGELVIAGMAPPGWRVEVETEQGKVGEVTAEFDGAWVLTPDKPLPKGDHSLALKATSPDGKRLVVSPQRVAVSVAENEKPLVALSAEGKPTRILESPSEPETKAPAAASGEGAAASGESREPASEAGDATRQTAALASSAAPAPREAGTVGVGIPLADSGGKSGSSSPAASAPESSGQERIAATTEPKIGLEPAPSVAFSAVDYEDHQETGRLFMSGKAASGSRIAVYIDNRFVGTAMADAGGLWEFSLSDVLGAGEHKLRADQVDLDTGKVQARAEVTFGRPEAVSEQASVSEQAPSPGQEMEAPTSAKTHAAESANPVEAERLARSQDTGAGTELAARHEQMPAAAGRDARSAKRKPRVVIVRRGDTLWHIARRYYGRGFRYSKIYRSNRDQIRNPHWIYPQQKFVIPQ